MLGNKINLGRHPSDKAILRMSQSRIGRKMPDDVKQKIRQARLGHPVSIETRLKLSIINKGRKYSPERNAKMSAALTGKKHTLETRLKMSERRKKDWQNPEWRARNLKAQQLFHERTLANDPEWYSRRAKAIMAGLRQARRQSELAVTDQSPITQRRLSPTHCAKIGSVKRKSWQDLEWRTKVIQAQIEGRKNALKRDPEWRKKQVAAQRRGYSCFLNKAESILSAILERDYPNEWRYVGNGSLIIGNWNPDFANVNGHKELIELFGDHWHRGQNPQDRIDLFMQFGFKTLVIWEKELKQPDKVRERIAEFIHARNVKVGD